MDQEITQEAGEVVQPSAIEQRALDQGWRPKAEFDGDPETFIDAPEFVRRGELFSKIEHQSKELKQVRSALEALKDHHSKVREAEYNRAMKTLEGARKQALAEGETDRFFALEEKMEEVKAEKEQMDADLKATNVPDTTINPEFKEWMDKNSWYDSSKPMRAYADKLGIELASEGHSPSEVLRMVEKEVKKEFAHKFQNQKATRPMAVEPSGRSNGRGDAFQLDDQERDIMRKFVRSGVMTEKEYIEQLKITKGVK